MALRQKSAIVLLPNLIRTLRNVNLKHPTQPLRRAYSMYDQINLITNVPDDELRFQEFDDDGFKVNGVKYQGSILCVGNLLLSWKPRKFSDVTQDSLSVFKILRPIPEILIVGCGKYIQPVRPEVRSFIRSMGMKLEVVDSRNAASTYNILNEEGRVVAAAMLPFGVED